MLEVKHTKQRGRNTIRSGQDVLDETGEIKLSVSQAIKQRLLQRG